MIFRSILFVLLLMFVSSGQQKLPNVFLNCFLPEISMPTIGEYWQTPKRFFYENFRLRETKKFRRQFVIYTHLDQFFRFPISCRTKEALPLRSYSSLWDRISWRKLIPLLNLVFPNQIWSGTTKVSAREIFLRQKIVNDFLWYFPNCL